jgi:hypothetical protein
MSGIPNLASLPSVPLADRKALPASAAIYFVLSGDTVLYIGQTWSLRQRWAAHHRLDQINEYGACRIAWIQVDDIVLLDDIERACIEHFSPVLNRQSGPSRQKFDETSLAAREKLSAGDRGSYRRAC